MSSLSGKVEIRLTGLRKERNLKGFKKKKKRRKERKERNLKAFKNKREREVV